jgi:cardiolipin synthase
VPDELLSRAIVAARKRGVRVRILVPGPYIDSATVRIASKAAWGNLLRAGAEIHVYQPTMLHTKMLVIDRELVSVGSTNFDPRSFRLNDEASLNIYDAGFAADMIKVFEADLQRATPYTLEMWRHRSLRERLEEKIVRPIRALL